MKISEGLKITGRLLTAAICAAVISSACSFLSFADAIRINVTYGYRNTAKSGQLLPVTVDIDNGSGEEFSGYMVIEVAGGSSTISFTNPVNVTEGLQSHKCTVTIPDDYSAEDGDLLKVRLLDDGGEELSVSNVNVYYQGNVQDVLTGLLSDSQQELLYLGNASLGEGLVTRTVTLNPADIPEDHEGLSQLDIIAISSFDPSRLSEEATEAIVEWVRGGGILILGTGTRKEPLGGFAKHLGSISLSSPVYAENDMGMQYSTTGPDGSVITLPLSRVNWAESAFDFGYGSIPLGSIRNMGSGRVCVTSFDLADINEFATMHPAFVEDFIETVLGDSAMLRIRRKSVSSEERLKSSLEFTNTYGSASAPSLFKYVITASAYVVLAGILLFYILRERGLGGYYPLGVLILSAAFGLIIWFESGGTRIETNYIDHGTVFMINETEDGEGHGVYVTGYMKLSGPGRSAFTLEFPSDTTIKPVTVKGDVSITSGKARMLALTGQKPFEESLFSISEHRHDLPQSGAFLCDLKRSGLTLIGTVANVSGYDCSDLFVVTGGEVIRIGSLKNGETADLSDGKEAYGPMTAYENVTAFVCGEDDGDSRAQRESLIRQCLRDITGSFSDDVYVIAAAEGLTPGYLKNADCTVRGSTVFLQKTDAEDLEAAYRSSLIITPQGSSGIYEASTNTVEESAATVLIYSLGSGAQIEGMKLVPLSAELAGNGIIPFRGQIAVYNYTKGVYDLLDYGKDTFTGSELKGFLSPTNNITLRFIPDEGGREDVKMYLPVPYALGSLPDAEAVSSGGPGAGMTVQQSPGPDISDSPSVNEPN